MKKKTKVISIRIDEEKFNNLNSEEKIKLFKQHLKLAANKLIEKIMEK